MTTTLAATHNGTCQACGRAQAFYKGTVAKHGYTVDWGHFNGVCRGAEAKPLEHDKTLTEATIDWLLNTYAPEQDKLAADLRSGAVEPRFYNTEYNRRTGKQDKIYCTRAELEFEHYETQDKVAQRQIDTAIHYAERDARYARSNAAMLRELITARHGKPLMPIIGRKVLAAGMSVRIGGKKGWVGKVLKVEYKVASGCGPYMNGRSLLHAFIERPEGRGVIAVPTKTIRQDAILESEVAQ